MKVGRNISIDKKIDQRFKDDPTMNASAICNQLLKTYFEEKENNKK